MNDILLFLIFVSQLYKKCKFRSVENDYLCIHKKKELSQNQVILFQQFQFKGLNN